MTDLRCGGHGKFSQDQGLWLLIWRLDATTGSQEKVCSRPKHSLHRKAFGLNLKLLAHSRSRPKSSSNASQPPSQAPPPVYCLILGLVEEAPIKRRTLPWIKECSWLTASIRGLHHSSWAGPWPMTEQGSVLCPGHFCPMPHPANGQPVLWSTPWAGRGLTGSAVWSHSSSGPSCLLPLSLHRSFS